MSPPLKIHISSIIIICLTLAIMVNHYSMRLLSLSYYNPYCSWHFFSVCPKIEVLLPSHYIHRTSFIIISLAFWLVIDHTSMFWMLRVTNNYALRAWLVRWKCFKCKVLIPSKYVHRAPNIEVGLIFFMMVY